MATVWDNASWQQQEFTHLLQRFVTAVQDKTASTELGQSLLAQLSQQIEQVLARLNTDFTLMVMGDFKRGKSTLVNALLQQELVPTSVTPETVTVNRIQFGAKITAVAHLHDDQEIPISIADLAIDRIVPLLSDEVDNSLPSDVATADRTLIRDLLSDAFNKEELANLCFELQLPYEDLIGESISAKVRELILKMERHGRFRDLVKECFRQRRQKFEQLLRNRPPIFRQLPELEKLRSKVKHVIIKTPSPFLQGIHLVDTPGMSDLISLFDNQIHDYLLKADVIIYVLSIRYPLSLAERDFLQRAFSSHDFAKLFFVINRIDEEDEATVKRFVGSVAAQIHQLFPQALVFGLSALDESCRVTGEERPKPDRSQMLEGSFRDFRQNLHESVIINRDAIQLDRAVADMEEILTDFEAHITRIQKASAANQQELHQTIEHYSNPESTLHQKFKTTQHQLTQEFSTLSQQACLWLDEFLGRLETETVPSLATATPGEIQRHFHIFLADTLSKALHECLNAQRPFILNIINQNRHSLRQQIRHTDTSEENSSQAAWQNLDIFDDVAQQSISSIYAFANEMLTTVASYLDNRHSLGEAASLHTYQEQLRDALPRLREAIMVEVNAFYDYLGSKLSRQVEAIHQQDIQAAVAALRQAQNVQQGKHGDETAVAASLQALLTITGQTRQNLQHFQQQLWAES